MNTDHYFYIGKTHTVCEDYALSGVKNGIHYAIVCDGCSGSPNTDIGARLLARSALSCIDRVHYDREFYDFVISKAAMQAKMLELSSSALDATLLVAASYKDTIYVKMYGDGCIVVKFKDGSTHIHEAEFPQNAPYYLNYLARDSSYIEEFKQYTGKFTYTDMVKLYTDNGVDIIDIIEEKAPENPSSMWKDLGYPKNAIEFVAVLSDGVKSFHSKKVLDMSISNEDVDYLDIISELTSFKTTKGEFVKRRASNALKKLTAQETYHKDDVSIAVLYNDETNS